MNPNAASMNLHSSTFVRVLAGIAISIGGVAACGPVSEGAGGATLNPSGTDAGGANVADGGSSSDSAVIDAGIITERDAASPLHDAEALADGSGSNDAGTADAGNVSTDDAQVDDAGAVPNMASCAGGTFAAPSDGGSANATGYGFIDIGSPAADPMTSLVTTLVVPPEPDASGTLFLWPGLQPSESGANFDPINNGVLQPVLTWGPTCAPNSPSSSYASWWVSGQYVNTYGSDTGFTGCQGGEGMTVAVGDSLLMTMVLSGTTWTQTITDQQSNDSVSFAFDMEGQSQNYAEFVIEGYSSEPTVPVQFNDTVVTFTSPSPSSCEPFQRGINDDFSAPQASTDGLHCCIASMTLRPEGMSP